MDINITNDEILTNLIRHHTCVVPERYRINKLPCSHEEGSKSIFHENQEGFKVIKTGMLPLRTILLQLLKANNIELHPEGFPIVDTPGISISLMKYFNGEIEMERVLEIYENLLTIGYISPVVVISVILVCGFDLATLFNSDNQLNYELWFKSLRGNEIRYNALSLAIGRLIIHHKFKSLMDDWSNDNGGYESTNFERFNTKIIPVLMTLETALMDEQEVYLTYFADLLSILRGQLSPIESE